MSHRKRRRDNKWSLLGTKTSRRVQRKNRKSKSNTNTFETLRSEWNSYLAGLSTADKKKLLINLVYVLPDTRTPNPDLASLQRGIEWLKNRLQTRQGPESISSLVDKTEGTLDSSAPTKMNESRVSAAGPFLQTLPTPIAANCLLELSSGTRLDARSHAETTISSEPSQQKKPNRQLNMLARSQEQEAQNTRRWQENVGKRVLEVQKRKSKLRKRENEEKTQRVEAQRIALRKKQSRELAHAIVDGGEVEKCTALLVDRARLRDDCQRLISEKRDADMKRVAAEALLKRFKQTSFETPFQDCTRTSRISQKLHDTLYRYVNCVTQSEFDKSRKEIDEGFNTETWYEFNSAESQVCTGTHIVCIRFMCQCNTVREK